jgi:hypothetical protein
MRWEFHAIMALYIMALYNTVLFLEFVLDLVVVCDIEAEP